MSSTEEELPEGWSRLESRSKPGRHYYLHRDTGERTWDRPLSHASETSEEPALAAPAPEPSAMEQPPREEPSSAQQQQQQQQQQQRASRRASDFWRSKSDVVHAALLPLPYTTRRSRPLRVVVPRREAHHSAVTTLWCDDTVVTLPLRPTPPGAAAAARGGGSSIENTVCVLSRSWRRFVHREHYSVCVLSRVRQDRRAEPPLELEPIITALCVSADRDDDAVRARARPARQDGGHRRAQPARDVGRAERRRGLAPIPPEHRGQ